MEKNYRVHPGTIMKTVLLSLGKSQNWLAFEMNMNKTVISNILHGKRTVTNKIAVSFEKATGYPARNLLNAQMEYDLFYSMNKNSSVGQTYNLNANFDESNNDDKLLLAI